MHFLSVAKITWFPSSDSDHHHPDGDQQQQILGRQEPPAEDLGAARHAGAAADHHHPTGRGVASHTHVSLVSCRLSGWTTSFRLAALECLSQNSGISQRCELTFDLCPQEIRRLMQERNDSSKNITKTIITKRSGSEAALVLAQAAAQPTSS